MDESPRLLEPDVLARIAAEHAGAYRIAEPFPHVVIDGLFPDWALDELAASFPAPATKGWVQFEDEAQRAKQMFELVDSPVGRRLVAELNGTHVVSFLEALTGVDGIVPDPHLVGGGLHQVGRGGFLKIHADFNVHTRLRLERRLNLLVYLNRDWQPEWGGELELWPSDMSACRVRVQPLFNRTVIFSTTSTSYHGHPDPLQCPPTTSRRSLALYYYRAPEIAIEDHSTLFQHRAGEQFRDPTVRRPRRLSRWVPPALVDATRPLRQRFRKTSQ